MPLVSANLKVTVHINMWSQLKKEQIKLEEKVKQLEQVVHQDKTIIWKKNMKIKELKQIVNKTAVKMVLLEVSLKEKGVKV